METFLRKNPTTKKELDIIALGFTEFYHMNELYNTIRKT